MKLKLSSVKLKKEEKLGNSPIIYSFFVVHLL